MSGFSNPVTNAIGTLVRSALQSLGFVSGSTGWRIAKDGSAEFNIGTFRGSVQIFDNIGNLVASVDATGIATGPSLQTPETSFAKLVPVGPIYGGGALLLQPGKFVSGGTTITYSNAPIVALVSTADGTANGAQGVLQLVSPGDNSQTNDGASINIMSRSHDTVTRSSRIILSASLIQVASGIVLNTEDWITVTAYQNGWTAGPGGLRYRKIACPPNSVQLIGNMTAGTKTDGTTIATLAAGYRPANAQDIYATSFNGALSTSQNPHFNILPTGEIKIYGLGTGTGCNLNGVIALDY